MVFDQSARGALSVVKISRNNLLQNEANLQCVSLTWNFDEHHHMNKTFINHPTYHFPITSVITIITSVSDLALGLK